MIEYYKFANQFPDGLRRELLGQTRSQRANAPGSYPTRGGDPDFLPEDVADRRVG